MEFRHQKLRAAWIIHFSQLLKYELCIIVQLWITVNVWFTFSGCCWLKAQQCWHWNRSALYLGGWLMGNLLYFQRCQIGLYNLFQIAQHYNRFKLSNQAGLKDYKMKVSGSNEDQHPLNILVCEQGSTSEALSSRKLKLYQPTPRYNKMWSNTLLNKTTVVLTITMLTCWYLAGFMCLSWSPS